MSIKILQPGLFASIQDLGRYGSQKYGVSVSGAMDPLASRIANLLVGNPEDEAVIEITMYGTKILFEEDHLISITGGFLQAKIDDEEAPMWRPVLVKKGQTLHFQASFLGCRSYIAFAGGMNIPKIMGSKSTYTKAKIGGLQGRILQKDDVIPIGEVVSDLSKSFIAQLEKKERPFEWSVQYDAFYRFRKEQTIRVLEGLEYDLFTEESKQHFVTKPYTLTTKADRLGHQLEGEKLYLSKPFELLSDGVTYGTIQIPANGQPIVLMADRQTTGGYPRIGQVISVDLPKLAQLQPSNIVHFELISLTEAQRLLIEQENNLHDLKLGIQFKGGI